MQNRLYLYLNNNTQRYETYFEGSIHSYKTMASLSKFIKDMDYLYLNLEIIIEKEIIKSDLKKAEEGIIQLAVEELEFLKA